MTEGAALVWAGAIVVTALLLCVAVWLTTRGIGEPDDPLS
jgi:hypothetical protein